MMKLVMFFLVVKKQNHAELNHNCQNKYIIIEFNLYINSIEVNIKYGYVWYIIFRRPES